MNIAFAGFRHSHILGLYQAAVDNAEVTIIGCCEENAREREKIAEKLGIAFNYNSYEEVLNDEKVEAVAIGDYYAKRGKMVIGALEHGKHVICDKPLCTDLTELAKIEALAEEKNLQVCCMLDLRYLPQVDRVKKMIESGELGEIHMASFTGQHCLDYGNRPAWYFEEGKHGGTINDIAIHGIDLIRFITSKNLSKVNCAKVWNAFADKEPNFKDCGQFMIEMDDISVMADVSYAAPRCNVTLPTYWDFYFWGTKGMVNFKYKDSKIYLYNEKEEIIECPQTHYQYLEDFIKETKGIDTIMKTKGIIETQRQVLTIQYAADHRAVENK